MVTTCREDCIGVEGAATSPSLSIAPPVAHHLSLQSLLLHVGMK